MAVRKRTWTTAKGEQREAWIVDYRDRQGDRHIETFARKKDADAKHAEVERERAFWRACCCQQEQDGCRGWRDMD